jgi:hypothetical protein
LIARGLQCGRRYFLEISFHSAQPERKTFSLPLTNSAPNLPAGNQELFVFQKVAGDWKIARYCFSAVNPPTLPQQVISIIERVPSPSSEVQSKSCLDITAATTADAPAEAPM